MGQIRLALFATLDLVGQGRPYDIFAGYWPHQNSAFADMFNRIPKYVASRGHPELSWSGSAHIGADLVTEVGGLRQRHEHVTVVGSLNFVQTLLREKLFDRMDLWVHPVVLGVGKKCSTGARCRPTGRCLRRRCPARRALCICNTGWQQGCRRRGT